MTERGLKESEIRSLERAFAGVKQAADEAAQLTRLLLGNRHPLVREARTACVGVDNANRAARATAEDLRRGNER